MAPGCKNWLILLLQKFVTNQTPVGRRLNKLLAVWAIACIQSAPMRDVNYIIALYLLAVAVLHRQVVITYLYTCSYLSIPFVRHQMCR